MNISSTECPKTIQNSKKTTGANPVSDLKKDITLGIGKENFCVFLAYCFSGGYNSNSNAASAQTA